MPRIKIVKAPKRKLNKFDIGGPTNCGEGTTWDTIQQKCVPSIQGVQSPMTQMNWGNMGNINGTAISAPPAPALSSKSPIDNQSTGTGNIWTNLGNMVQESNRKDEKLLNIGSYNPFDVKWGQQQNSPLPDDIFSDDYKRMMGQLPNSKGASGTGMNPTQKQKGDGTLNTAQLTSDYANVNVNNKKKSGLWGQLHDVNQRIDNAVTMANMALSFYDNRKKQKEYDKWMAQSMQPQNYYAAQSGNRGDYEINNGMFRADDMGYKSKGTQANQYYAQQNFAKYGGSIPYAAEGISVPGDEIVQKAFLPDVSTDVVGPVKTVAPETSSNASSPVIDSPYVLPVQNFKITSGFGHRKAPKGPNGPASTEHNGLDLAVPVNSNVFAPMDGVVKSIYSNGQGGNQLLVQHSDGSVSGYAHLNGYKVKVGDPVGKGQVIALSGNTGNSNGPHLHFTWHTPDGKTIDPRSIFNFDLGNLGKGKQTSLTHNNPLNVHYGNFASKYGAVSGADDAGGKVAKFADLQIGIQANKDLLFGPNYNNLTIAEARNKWVSGNPSVYSSSTNEIIKAMGGNKRLSSLSDEEKDKLFKLFAKWEGSQAYNQIKDIKIFKEGGQTNNSKIMKIRIVSGPEHMDKGGEPKYSGQSDYGLYIGQRNLYNTMAKNPYTDAADNVSEQPESKNNPHVLEAEGGETILRPDGTHMKISGPSHAQGGVKLNKSQAPEDSFIYSNTQKMKIKNPQVLQHFGKSLNKSGVTPADIAKQYDVNKYLGIIQNPNTDSLAKQTAMRMIQNYQKKLAELALVQESIKGFPQGIPEVAKAIMGQGQQPGASGQSPQLAKYGGALRKFVDGGLNDYDPEFLNAIKFMTDYEQQGSSAGPKGYIGGGKNWGTNRDDIKTKEDAIKYYYNNYWPRVKDLPPGLRTRALQMAINTGDPYGELMVAGSSFKGVDPMSPEDRIATKDQRKDLSPDQFTGDDWKKRQAQVLAAYNANPTQFMQNLDAEQNRYYNQGLQGITDDQKKFLTGYYKGVGNIANDYMVKSNPVSNDPFGIMASLLNAGKTNTTSGVSSTTVTTPQATTTAQGPVPKWFTPWIKSNTKAGRTSPKNLPTVFDPKDPNKFYVDYGRWKNIAQKEGVLKQGQDFTNPKEYQDFIYNYVNKKDPAAIQKMWDTWGTTAKGKTLPKDQQFSINAFSDSDLAPKSKPYFGARTAELSGWEEQPLDPGSKFICIDGNVSQVPADANQPGVVYYNSESEARAACVSKEETTTTTTSKGDMSLDIVPGGNPEKYTGNYAWTDQDVRDLGNAGLDYASLKKYHPYRANVQPVLPEFIPVDWRGYAAALQSGQNAAANQMATYQPGQSLGANLSFLQGQTAGELGKYISGVDQYNASGASNMDLQRAGIQNQFNMYNAENRNKNFEDENVYDDRYRTAERLARKGIVKAWNQGQDNATKIYNLNQVESPYYQIHAPTQKMVFNSDNARARWIAENRGGYQAAAGSGAKAAAELKDIYDNLSFIPEAERAQTAYDIWNGGNGGGKITKRNYPYNTNKNYEQTTTKTDGE